jgi:hypothetical protein
MSRRIPDDDWDDDRISVKGCVLGLLLVLPFWAGVALTAWVMWR